MEARFNVTPHAHGIELDADSTLNPPVASGGEDAGGNVGTPTSTACIPRSLNRSNQEGGRVYERPSWRPVTVERGNGRCAEVTGKQSYLCRRDP